MCLVLCVWACEAFWYFFFVCFPYRHGLGVTGINWGRQGKVLGVSHGLEPRSEGIGSLRKDSAAHDCNWQDDWLVHDGVFLLLSLFIMLRHLFFFFFFSSFLSYTSLLLLSLIW
ncbi:hypothetical protein BGZ63DRAFT_264148 [Mariannaea sp. PMI_226]|nr:hypothetical protein BGZ63DRAFT_264148 [Mariannaea sp. PMI_226]